MHVVRAQAYIQNALIVLTRRPAQAATLVFILIRMHVLPVQYIQNVLLALIQAHAQLVLQVIM